MTNFVGKGSHLQFNTIRSVQKSLVFSCLSAAQIQDADDQKTAELSWQFTVGSPKKFLIRFEDQRKFVRITTVR
ncbi:hypothetical protein KOR42_54230 [Thalassoglobus neptunius]|uniref:Uncharacterized protein n=1 Tax=Thalassoglobus neptunius TaxID=1938619 RepID=A0A5C5UYM5_9PLAN|nr:hypothetical protein KOR42_54230 [Thalassoglobus neptunius]